MVCKLAWENHHVLKQWLLHLGYTSRNHRVSRCENMLRRAYAHQCANHHTLLHCGKYQHPSLTIEAYQTMHQIRTI